MAQKKFLNIMGIITIAGISMLYVNRGLARPISSPKPFIQRIVPDRAAVGTQVTIIGLGFDKKNNTVHFKNQPHGYLYNLPSITKKIIAFEVPYAFSGCSSGAPCKARPIPIVRGHQYEIAVINSKGQSNYAELMVLSGDPHPPVYSPPRKNTETKVSWHEGYRMKKFLLKKIYPDFVTGIIFKRTWDDPVTTECSSRASKFKFWLWWKPGKPECPPSPVIKEIPVTIKIGETINDGCNFKLTLIGIEKDRAMFIKKTDFDGTCRPGPICLAQGIHIDTPSGKIPVENLNKGDHVWTLNAAGERVSAPILRKSRALVPPNHKIIDLMLDDGRGLKISAGHPVKNGRIIENFSEGDFLDGGRILSIKHPTYVHDYTYDILPAGETGLYWANDILLDSTLR